MGRFSLLCGSVGVLVPALLFGQSGSDPLGWTKPIDVQSGNIFLLRSQQSGGGSTMESHQRVFRYLVGSGVLPASQRLYRTQDHLDEAAVVGGNQQMDAASGYLTNNVFENVVAAWEGPNQTIQIMIPHFDSTQNAWSSASELTVPGPVVPYGGGQRGRIYVRTGDFLGTGRDQIVLAYQGADSTIHLQVYEVDDSLDPHLTASINDDTLLPTPSQYARFSVTTGDLNGDGKEEIILDWVKQDYDGLGRWAIYVKVYEVSNSSITPEGSQMIFPQPKTYSIQAPQFGISAGRFKVDGEDQIAFACAANQSGGENAYLFIYMLEASQDLSALTYDPARRDSVVFGTSGSLTDFSIASGDLNDDDRDELVLDIDDQIRVYSTDDSLTVRPRTNFAGLSGGSEDDQLSYDFLAVGDLNEDGSNEVIVEKDIYGIGSTQWTEIAARELSADLSTDSLVALASTDTSADNGGNSYYRSAVVIGAFDGGHFRIEAPQHHVVSSVVQPLVILNTPPVHFDILNGVKYDLSNSFEGSGSSFYATYEQQSSTTVNLETQTHNDVADAAGLNLTGNVSETATLSAEFLGAGAQVSFSVAQNFQFKVENTWGHSFSSDTTSAETRTLTIGVTALGDDYVYETTSSYDLWSYPVYEGNASSPVDYLNFASPILTLPGWFQSKTYASTDYVPNHEVGNILSYLPSADAIQNPNIDSSIVSVPQSQGLPISGQSGSYWDLNFTKYLQSSLDSTWNNGWDIDINTAPEFKSTGNNARMRTQTTTISSGFDLRATFGTLVDSLGNEAAYTVYPYAYRSKAGAIVIDYAVDPVLGGAGSPSWWQNQYGTNSDPTFILPWFYDPEKGIGLSFSAKRYQTTDIIFSNNAPQPGDTISITARIRNFSLVPTPTPVTVRFYVGDPDSGGTLIIGVGSVDSAVTGTFIRDRKWADATMQWVVPSGLVQGARIYAIVDPENHIQEVHEENNKGFAVLGQAPLTEVAQNVNPALPKSPMLYQAYPNPFNPTTTIRFDLPSTANVLMEVYNVLGQQVATLVNGPEQGGSHQVRFNAEGLASGVYIYRMEASPLGQAGIRHVFTGKVLLIK